MSEYGENLPIKYKIHAEKRKFSPKASIVELLQNYDVETLKPQHLL